MSKGVKDHVTSFMKIKIISKNKILWFLVITEDKKLGIKDFELNVNGSPVTESGSNTRMIQQVNSHRSTNNLTGQVFLLSFSN